ncbi:hypothetical protein [Streptomyces apricus]|uniref:Lipoprotein n=1 Tax=Streptomyces apricus TaxID=1828112 RepID=A0A5B0BIR0_9ACTN|nr:hypothetical protein [Streptomyces apricus]KAA0941536.1 hypothetical protein FGF04_06195 [Streptomyces apricus]
MTRVREVSGSTRSRAAAALCAGLLVAALTGCGGGEEKSAGASTAPAGTTGSAPPPVTSPPVDTPSAVETPTTEDTATASSPEPEEEPVAEDASDASALWGTRYSGTAEVSVDVYDFCASDGSRRLADSQSYSLDATLDLGRPRSAGDETEDNPFSLLFAAGDPAKSGAVSFWSSAVGTASSEDLAGNSRDPQTLLTYWDVGWADGELDARLTDPHTAQAVALNLLNWASPVVACRADLGLLPGGSPHPLAVDTTFSGQLDSSTASLTAEGDSTDSLIEFRFEFDGTAS